MFAFGLPVRPPPRGGAAQPEDMAACAACGSSPRRASQAAALERVHNRSLSCSTTAPHACGGAGRTCATVCRRTATRCLRSGRPPGRPPVVLAPPRAPALFSSWLCLVAVGSTPRRLHDLPGTSPPLGALRTPMAGDHRCRRRRGLHRTECEGASTSPHSETACVVHSLLSDCT